MRLAVALVLFLTLAGVALAAPASELPSAFERPATAEDRLPSFLPLRPGEGRPYDSRLIATHATWKWTWRVYVFKQARRAFRSERIVQNVCLFVVQNGDAGGGCSPAASFFGPGRQLAASATGRALVGVASDRVARIVVVGSRGVRHDVPLSADHGFFFNCRAYNGCACVVARVQALDRAGRLITDQNWRSPARNCRQR